MKKVLCLLLSMVMLSQAASATNLWDEAPASDETVESGTEEAIEQSIDQADGQLVNPDPDHSFTDAQATEYSYTPLDVVLVLDTSGSMGEPPGADRRSSPSPRKQPPSLWKPFSD